MKFGFFYLLILFLITFIPTNVLFTLNIHTQSNGIFVLEKSAKDTVHTVPISGEAEFYWMELLLPTNFQYKASLPTNQTYVSIPSYWNYYDVVKQHGDGLGYATYHFKIIIPDTNSNYGFRIPTIGTAYKFWVNGVLEASAGMVGTNKNSTIPDYHTTTVFVDDENGILDIVIQVANFHHPRGGIWESIEFGTENAIKHFRHLKIALELFISGILFIMFLYHLYFYLNHRRDHFALYFAISCFAVMVRILVVGEYYLYVLIPDGSWGIFTKLEYLSLNIVVMSLLAFTISLYKKYTVTFINKMLFVAFAINSVIILITPPLIFAYTMWSFTIIAFISGGYAIFTLILATINKQRYSGILLFGIPIYVFISINEILYATSNLLRFGWLMPLAHFILVIVHAYIISKRLFKAYKTAEELSNELEKKVEIRTADLFKTNKELNDIKNQIEKEKNLLWQKTLEIENDLEFAREIQKNFIPEKSPDPNLSFYYQPMEKVGGDYFDFAKFPMGKGVFISDVSGHGVAAALITSMIKSFFQQYSAISVDPAMFLYRLNDFLINLTGEHFVTAFYGILNERTGEFTYSNAGHPPPILINSKGANFINASRMGFILGAFDKEHIRGMHLKYKNKTLKLEPNDKILFYTDGISEAFPYNVNNIFYDEDYGHAQLIKDINELHNSPKNMCIENLIEKLIEFRGCDTFEDDICVVCMKVDGQSENKK